MEATVKKQDQDGDGAIAVKIGSGSKRNGDTNNKMTRPRAKLKFGLDKTRLPLVSGKGNYLKLLGLEKDGNVTISGTL